MNHSKVICCAFTIALAIGMTFGEAPLPQYGPPGFGGGNGNGYSGGRPSSNYGAPGGGGNGGYSNEDGGKPEPFSFEYEVKDAQSGNDFGHKAQSDGTRVQGQYHVLLPDGRNQIVDYTADDSGYNANVKYEGQANGGGGYPGAQGGGYPSPGAPSGGNGYPSSGGYPSPGGGNGGYPSAGGPPGSSYLPPGK